MTPLAAHEAGHAVAARHFGLVPQVEPYGDGMRTFTLLDDVSQAPPEGALPTILIAGVVAEAMLTGEARQPIEDLALLEGLGCGDVDTLNALTERAEEILVTRYDELVATADELEGALV